VQLTQLRRVRPAFLLLAAMAQCGVYVCLGLILRQPLNVLKYRTGVLELAADAFCFLFANRSLPGPAVAGLAVLGVRLGRRNIPSRAAHTAAFVFFAADYAGFLPAVLLTLVKVLQDTPAGSTLRIMVQVGIVAIVAGTVAFVLVLGRLDVGGLLARRFFEWLGGRFKSERLFKWGERAEIGLVHRGEALAQVSSSPGMLYRALIWSMGMHACEIATIWLVARGAGTSISLLDASSAYVCGNLASIVSFVPGALGFFEAGSIASLTVISHVPWMIAVIVTIGYRALSLWIPAFSVAGLVTDIARAARRRSGAHD
jgi:uncharacterized protein (TIRG00374 family)